MARKPKNGKSGPTEVVATTLLLPPAGTLADLSKGKKSARKRVREVNEDFATKFSKATEKKHVDRRAANICFNLDSLSDEQLHVTYFHLMAYMDDMGIVARATKQEEMFAAGQTGPGLKKEGEGEGEGEGGDGAEADADNNVRRIGTAARSVADRAGA